MNSSVISRRNNHKFFFASLGVAILLVAASGFFLKHVLARDSGAMPMSIKTCLDTLRAHGFNPKQKADVIQASVVTTAKIESLVNQSGVLIASCPAYTLTDYCAGAGCQTSGVAFTLKQKEL